jgi:cell division protein FtsA
LPVGGDHVTNDIAVGLRTPITNAEKLKIRSGCALANMVGEEEKLEVLTTSGKSTRDISRKLLCEIIEPRVDEIFGLVKRELAEAGYDGLIPAGVVITGGASLMKGLPELASEKLDLPVRRGIPERTADLKDFIDNNIYLVGNEEVNISEDSTAMLATGVGLIYYGSQQKNERSIEKKGKNEGINNLLAKARAWFEDVF